MRKIFTLGALTAATLIAAVATGCTGTSASGEGAMSFTTINTGTAYRLLNSAREFGTEEDIVFTDSVSLVMPDRLMGGKTGALRDSILSVAFDSVGADTRSVIAGYMDKTAAVFGYPVEKVDTLAAGTTADGFTRTDGTIVNLTPELLVYCVTTSDYQPRAAHGMSTSYYINYDIKEQRVLGFDDIFDTAKTDSLTAAIQTQADALEQVIGPTTIAALPEGNNFMLSPTGEIVFVFQPYEVASYAQGTIRVAFYPYELVEYMTPFAVKFFNLGDID